MGASDTSVRIDGPEPVTAAACEAVLRALPDWFGIESALLEYARDTGTHPTFVARDGETLVGFLTVRRHFAASAEVHCMAIVPERHGRGIGRRLLRAVETWLGAQGVVFLQVKTLGPSRPDAHYERTRGFYAAMGFSPLEEMLTLWEGHPCLVLVKRVGAA